MKLMNFTSMSGKFLAVLPLASSQSPSSGDHYLLMRFDDIQRNNGQQETYVRALLSGNDEYFIILVVDAGNIIFIFIETVRAFHSLFQILSGFTVLVRNRPRQVHNLPTLAEIAEDCHAFLLHTSSKNEAYCLARDTDNKIVKVPQDPNDPTSIENSVKFTRIFRIVQEMAHSGLKNRFKFLDAKHLANSALFALKPHQMVRYGLPEAYKNVSRLSIIAIVCCCLHNSTHPGYSVLYIRPEDQVAAADRLLNRVFLKNPLMHPDLWNINFVSQGGCWTTTTFGDIQTNHGINFPQLQTHQVNPVATDLVSGPHAILKSFSLATYMGQLMIKDQNLNLTRQETELFLQNFPVDWPAQFCYVRTPDDFVPTPQNPYWSPQGYETLFGAWPGDVCFVRVKIPPSHTSATSPSNFHYAVIGFVENPSVRLGLLPPYDRIVMWRCFSCPALNGMMSMCRHLATALMGLSYPQEYKSTFKSVDVLNTVATTQRQMLLILPPTQISQPIPVNIQRRSVSHREGSFLYDSSNNSGNTTTSSTSTATASVANVSVSVPSPSSPVSAVTSIRVSVITPTSNASTPSTSQVVRPTITPASSLPVPAIAPSPSAAAAARNAIVIGQLVARESKYTLFVIYLNYITYVSILGQFDRLLANHVNLLNLPPILSIPGPSYRSMSTQFQLRNLASQGLTNDSNNCCLLSCILCCHRISLNEYFVDPVQVVCNGTRDYAVLLFMKVLDALPTNEDLSLQQFIFSWNHTAPTNGLGRPMLGQYEDILLCDTIIGAMKPYLKRLQPPVLTQYLAKFFCELCHVQYSNIDDGSHRFFQCVPLLPLPVTNRAVSPGQLLTNFLNSSFEAICPVASCQNRCRGATYEAIKGRFTLMALNRRHYRDAQGNLIPKLMTKLSTFNGGTIGDQLCGELVSVICHSGNPNGGHWTSYHKCDNNTWWINNDSNPVIQSPVHPFDGRSLDESVDFLVFKNH